MIEFKTYVFSLPYLLGNKLDRRENFIVHEKDPHPQSAAMLLLIKMHYLKMSVRLEGRIPYNTRVWLTFRNKFLKRMKKQTGDLVCFYCLTPNLTANVNSPTSHNRKATVDHYIPLAKGGKKFNTINLKVCCENCNHKKKDLMPEEFMTRVAQFGKNLRVKQVN